MDEIVSKLAGCSIAISLYLMALRSPKIGQNHFIFGVLFFTLCSGLGYDTLSYKWMIEDESIFKFGWIWGMFGKVYSLTGIWWVVYICVYACLVPALFRLSKVTSNPALAFAMLITLPGLGFSYLSILRQGFATALLIHGCLNFNQKYFVSGFVLLILSTLAHSSCLPWVLVFLCYQTVAFGRLKIGRLSIALTSLVFTAMIFSSQDILDLLRISRMYEIYVENRGASDVGQLLAYFWCGLGGSGLVLGSVRLRDKITKGSVLRVCCTLIVYITVYSVFGDGVRFAWYLLPLLVFDLVNSFKIEEHSNFGRAACYTIVLGILLLSLYPILNAPDYFWRNQYPFGWFDGFE